MKALLKIKKTKGSKVAELTYKVLCTINNLQFSQAHLTIQVTVS